MKAEHMMRLMYGSFAAALITGLQGCSGSEAPAPTPPAEIVEANQPWDYWTEAQPSWVAPSQPFNVVSNIYYVGTEGIGSFLITSNDGHILLDGGLPQSAGMIADNIKALGFDVTDVKILLNSHAHFDHSGGLAKLKALSGAEMIASAADRPWLESGHYPGSIEPRYSAPPVMVDRLVMDQEAVELGPIRIKANLTPGHSPGCTSWTMTVTENGTPYDVLFFCSASVGGNELVDPPQHEGIVDDYRRTFEITKDWKPDIFLANHPVFFDLETKREARLSGDSLAFVDRGTFSKLMRNFEMKFEKALAEQTLAARAKTE